MKHTTKAFTNETIVAVGAPHSIARIKSTHGHLIVAEWQDEDGYWIGLASGYMNASDPWCHQIHEDTKQEAYEELEHIVRCDCPEHKRCLKARAAFLAIVAKYPGVTLDEESCPGALNLDSPKGFVFAANDCHNMVEWFENNGGQSWKPDAYKDLAERLTYGTGLLPCTDEECDICHPEEN